MRLSGYIKTIGISLPLATATKAGRGMVSQHLQNTGVLPGSWPRGEQTLGKVGKAGKFDLPWRTYRVIPHPHCWRRHLASRIVGSEKALTAAISSGFPSRCMGTGLHLIENLCRHGIQNFGVDKPGATALAVTPFATQFFWPQVWVMPMTRFNGGGVVGLTKVAK